jgi:hypothetical protein
MTWKNRTVIFIIVIIAAIASYDVLTISKGGIETSISHTMIVWAYKYPIFTFLMGVTMGHLFWRMRDTKETSQISENIEKKD